MNCRAIKIFVAGEVFRKDRIPSLNAPPTAFSPKPKIPQDSYLCEGEGLDSILKQSSPSPLWGEGWGEGFRSPPPASPGIWGKPGMNAAPPRYAGLGLGGLSPLAPAHGLPPPPEAALSRLLFEILSQLKDFELSADLKVPVIHRDMKREVGTHTQIVLGEHGRLDAARIKFDPYWGPVTLPGPAAGVVREVPIIGIFAIYRLLSVEMDPKNRKIVGKGSYLFFPITKELQELLVEKGKIPSDLVKGPGYDLNRGLPKYSWQIADIAEQILKRNQTEGFKEIGKATKLDTIVPLFDKGQVRITGDFSNQEIVIGPVTLKFSPKKKGEAQRILLEGGITEPKMKVWGLKSIEVQHAHGTLRLGHIGDPSEPLELSWKLNFDDFKASRMDLARLDSRAFLIENVSSDPKKNLSFTLREGLSLKNLWLTLEGGSPHLHIQEVEARQGELEGFGVRFKTSPKDKAVLRQIHLEMKNGFPHLHARIAGSATGELSYSKTGEELAWLNFKDLKGSGSIRTGRDEKNRVFFTLSGDIATQIPSLRLLVRSEQLKGYVRTEIGDALVKGKGSLTVWPEEEAASLVKLTDAPPLSVRGSKGKVVFHQDTSKVAAWPELERELGKTAARVQSDLTVDLQDIGFEIEQMHLEKSQRAKSETPSLEILKAKISDIRIQGDLYGRLWVRLPGGMVHPIVISETAKMRGATVKVGGLKDFEADGKRNVIFERIFISGEESQATLKASDQKRCGFDRQHIHADLGLFGFSPDTKEFQLQNLGSHFHIYLKNPPYGGGCLTIA